jgi:hypothetical protein
MLKEIIGEDYCIIDNALPRIAFEKLREVVTSHRFPWRYVKYTSIDTVEEKSAGSFAHQAKGPDELDHISYPLCEMALYSALSKVDNMTISDITRVRIGMFVPQNENIIHSPHVDNIHEPHIVALLYMEDSDGPTYLHNLKYDFNSEYRDYRIEDLNLNESVKVECKTNRMVLFDGGIYHSSTNHTDVDRRIAINYNFLP